MPIPPPHQVCVCVRYEATAGGRRQLLLRASDARRRTHWTRRQKMHPEKNHRDTFGTYSLRKYRVGRVGLRIVCPEERLLHGRS